MGGGLGGGVAVKEILARLYACHVDGGYLLVGVLSSSS